MLAGRIVYGVLNALIFSVGKYSFAIFVSGAFVTSARHNYSTCAASKYHFGIGKSGLY
jgi:hypothetical protein